MLGATLNEDATEKTLLSSMSKMRLLQSLELDEHDGSHTLRHKRSMSYPPPSPTASSHLANSNSNSSRQNIYDSHQASASAYDFGLSPFSDSTASRASSSAGFNPTSPGTEFSPLTPYDLATGSDHWDKPGAYGTRDSIREARRRRVRKLHAMLGEQVPLEVILEYEHKNAIGNNRSLQSSPDLSSQPDRKHARNPSRFGQAIARLTGSGKKREQTASNENQSSSDDEEQWTGPPSPVDISSWPSDAPFTARDKKLVALFGALPFVSFLFI